MAYFTDPSKRQETHIRILIHLLWVRDARVTTSGYQGTPAPNQWFGGPALSAGAGNMVLRDAAGLVVDSLNYGGLVDPWASEGYQATSGAGQSGCRVPTPGSGGRGFGGPGAPAAGANNVKVASVADFGAGQTIMIDTGENLETAVIATVGTSGATTVGSATAVGATITVAAPLIFAHAAGAQVSGTGITLTGALTRPHAAEAQVAGSIRTPGAPNQYYRKELSAKKQPRASRPGSRVPETCRSSRHHRRGCCPSTLFG